jgi:hypothetical protein
MTAHAVSTAVYERLGPEPVAGTVLALSGSAIHVDAGGFVVTIVDRRAPLPPNALAVPARLDAAAGLPVMGASARLAAGAVEAGGLRVTWDPSRAPLWDARVPCPEALPAAAVSAWSAEVLAELGSEEASTPDTVAEHLFGPRDVDGRTGLIELLGSVRRGDPGAARGAARLLTGRGPGLTPAGDDLLAGAAAAVAALGAALGFGPRRGWGRAVVVPDLAHRTTAVSATLLRLAAAGLAPEPLHGVLDGSGDPRRGMRSLRRLLRLGHTTGWACGAAAGLCMAELATAAQPVPRRTREEPA